LIAGVSREFRFNLDPDYQRRIVEQSVHRRQGAGHRMDKNLMIARSVCRILGLGKPR
jgi:hypothetical protein